MLSQHGGIVPAARRHSLLTLILAEREDISRGIEAICRFTSCIRASCMADVLYVLDIKTIRILNSYAYGFCRSVRRKMVKTTVQVSVMSARLLRIESGRAQIWRDKVFTNP